MTCEVNALDDGGDDPLRRPTALGAVATHPEQEEYATQ